MSHNLVINSIVPERKSNSTAFFLSRWYTSGRTTLVEALNSAPETGRFKRIVKAAGRVLGMFTAVLLTPLTLGLSLYLLVDFTQEQGRLTARSEAKQGQKQIKHKRKSSSSHHKKKNKELKTKLDQLRHDLETTRVQAQRAANIETQLRQEIERLRNAPNLQTSEQIQRLQEQLTKTSKEKNNALARLQVLEKQKQEEIEKHREAAALSENIKASLKQQLQVKTSFLDTALKENKQLKSAAETHNQKAQNLASQVASLRNQIQILKQAGAHGGQETAQTIQHFQAQLNQLEQEKTQCVQSSTKLRQELQESQRTILLLSKEKDQALQQLTALESADPKKQEVSIRALNLQISILKGANKLHEEELVNRARELEKLRTQLQEAMQQKQQAEAAARANLERAEQLSAQIAQNTSVPANNEAVHELQQQVKQLQKELDETERSYQSYKALSEDLEARVGYLLSPEAKGEELNEVRSQLDNLNIELEKLEQQNLELQEKVKNLEVLEQLKQQFASLQAQQAQKDQAVLEANAQVVQLQEELKQALEQEQNNAIKIQQLTEQNQKIQATYQQIFQEQEVLNTRNETLKNQVAELETLRQSLEHIKKEKEELQTAMEQLKAPSSSSESSLAELADINTKFLERFTPFVTKLVYRYEDVRLKLEEAKKYIPKGVDVPGVTNTTAPSPFGTKSMLFEGFDHFNNGPVLGLENLTQVVQQNGQHPHVLFNATEPATNVIPPKDPPPPPPIPPIPNQSLPKPVTLALLSKPLKRVDPNQPDPRQAKVLQASIDPHTKLMESLREFEQTYCALKKTEKLDFNAMTQQDVDDLFLPKQDSKGNEIGNAYLRIPYTAFDILRGKGLLRVEHERLLEPLGATNPQNVLKASLVQKFGNAMQLMTNVEEEWYDTDDGDDWS